MAETIVEMRNVCVSYDGYEVLRDVSLDVYTDDFIGIIGPNGGGKTTLVKSILGSVPHTGTITLSPELYSGGERHIGYLPQQSNFDRNFPITVADVVMSGLQSAKGFMHGYTRKDKAHALELPILPDARSARYREASCNAHFCAAQ